MYPAQRLCAFRRWVHWTADRRRVVLATGLVVLAALSARVAGKGAMAATVAASELGSASALASGVQLPGRVVAFAELRARA